MDEMQQKARAWEKACIMANTARAAWPDIEAPAGFWMRYRTDLMDAILEARQVEREACAEVAEVYNPPRTTDTLTLHQHHVCNHIARAIRQREGQ